MHPSDVGGVGLKTAAIVVSAIDGIERFGSPDKLVSFFGADLSRGSPQGKRERDACQRTGVLSSDFSLYIIPCGLALIDALNIHSLIVKNVIIS